MKPLSVVLALTSVLLLASCADQREQITGEEIGQKLQRGASGEGRLTPIDRGDDPNIRHNVPETHP